MDVLSLGPANSISSPHLSNNPLGEHLDVHPCLQLDDQTTLSGDPSEVLLDPSAVGVTTAQTGSSEPGPSVSVDDVHQAETSHSYSSASTSNLSDIPLGNIEDLWEGAVIRLESLKVSVDFIKSLRNATLDDPSIGLSEEAIYRLRNPNWSQPQRSIDDDTRMAKA